MKHIDLSPFQGRTLSDADWQHLMMRILFTPRDMIPCFAESILRKAERPAGLNPELADPLLTLLGFTSKNLPRMSHTFNSEMGNLFETVVKVALKLSNEDLYSDDFSSFKEYLSPSDLAHFKKNTADCIFGASAIEVKYRYGSSEGLTKQKQASKPLEAMGFDPVMLCFRSSPNTDEIRSAGWDVFEGQCVIDYVRERTGYDLSRIFQVSQNHPLIRKRIDALQAEYAERTRSKLRADFKWAPDDHRAPIHKLIASDDDMRAEFLDVIGCQNDILRGFLDDIFRDPHLINNFDISPLVAEVTNNKNEMTSHESEKVI